MKNNLLKRLAHWSFPVTIREALIVAASLPVSGYVAYSAILKPAPEIVVYSETLYPPQVEQNSFFFLAYDMAFSETCDIITSRFLKSPDGSEVNIGSDKLSVKAGARNKYVVQIPIPASLPTGTVSIRSDMTYACDFWGKFVQTKVVRGYPRVIEVVPENALAKESDVSSYKLSWLPQGVPLDRPRTRKTLPAGS